MTTATKTKAPKVSATYSSIVVDAYSKLINLEGEQAFIALCTKRLKSNASSVRDIQASIEKANGTAPTIRSSHVQYFITMDEILNKTEGAKLVSIAELIKMAQRLQTAVGKPAIEATLEKVANYAQLASETPTLQKTRERKNAQAPKAPHSLETIMTKAVSDINVLKGNGSVQSLKTADLQTLATLAELLRVIAINSGMKPKVKA